MIEFECRALSEGDLVALERVIAETTLFPIEMLRPMAAGALTEGSGELWRSLIVHGEPVGMSFTQPEDMAENVWNMRAIAVRPDLQGKGGGKALIHDAEAALKAQGARLIIVDTSGDEAFAATRGFYRDLGYAEEARIRNFWAIGDDKVTFTKPL